VPGDRFQALWTHLPPRVDALNVWRRYHGRADSENRLRELGAQFGIKGLRARSFWATEALHPLAIAAYNLCVLLQRQLGQLEKCELNTLRWRLFGRAAVWSRATGQADLETGRAWRGGARLVAGNTGQTHSSAQLQFSWLAPGLNTKTAPENQSQLNRSGSALVSAPLLCARIVISGDVLRLATFEMADLVRRFVLTARRRPLIRLDFHPPIGQLDSVNGLACSLRFLVIGATVLDALPSFVLSTQDWIGLLLIGPWVFLVFPLVEFFKNPQERAELLVKVVARIAHQLWRDIRSFFFPEKIEQLVFATLAVAILGTLFGEFRGWEREL
jgi:hypothetical protein